MVKKEINELIAPKLEKNCTIAKGLILESLKDSKEGELVEITPCTSERGKVMAEIDEIMESF